MSNYSYNYNNYLALKCIFNSHIIAKKKTPNDLTSPGVFFMLIFILKKGKGRTPSRPKQQFFPPKIRAIALITNYYDKIIF